MRCNPITSGIAAKRASPFFYFFRVIPYGVIDQLFYVLLCKCVRNTEVTMSLGGQPTKFVFLAAYDAYRVAYVEFPATTSKKCLAIMESKVGRY